MGREPVRVGNGCGGLFSAGPADLCIASQNSPPSPSYAALRPLGPSDRRCRPAPPPLFVACEGRDGRGRQTDRQDTMSIDPDFEPLHEQSPTSSLLDELQLSGHRPFRSEEPTSELQSIMPI